MAKRLSMEEHRERARKPILAQISLEENKLRIINEMEFKKVYKVHSIEEYKYNNRIIEFHTLFIPKVFNLESVNGMILAELHYGNGQLEESSRIHLHNNRNKRATGAGTLKMEHIKEISLADITDYPLFVGASYISPEFHELLSKI